MLQQDYASEQKLRQRETCLDWSQSSQCNYCYQGLQKECRNDCHCMILFEIILHLRQFKTNETQRGFLGSGKHCIVLLFFSRKRFQCRRIELPNAISMLGPLKQYCIVNACLVSLTIYQEHRINQQNFAMISGNLSSRDNSYLTLPNAPSTNTFESL